MLTPGTSIDDRKRSKAVAALITGVTCIGAAPILVRLSEVGPSATAFYRVLIVLPIYWLLATREPAGVRKCFRDGNFRWIGAAGFFFAADLCLWHWSLRYTTVANSTLLTNLAPVFVLIGARTFLREASSRKLIASVAIAMVGSAMLVASSAKMDSKNLFGDVLSLITAVFYAGYLVTLKRARRQLSTSAVMAGSGLISCPLMFAAGWTAGENFAPRTGWGWMVLIALGVISHLAGQGLIAYGLAHVQAGFSAAALLWQPVVAALLAALVLNESLTEIQMVG